jgi:hypothetical protein
LDQRLDGMRLLVTLLLIFGAQLCLAQADSIAYQIIFVGDAGSSVTDDARQLISRHLPPSSVPSSVVFLGDNVYPKGLPGARHHERKSGEQILLNKVEMAAGYGNVYLIPGNHDWKDGHHEGFQYLMNQQLFIDSLRMPQVKLLPRDGCPGPEEIHLTKDLLLVIIDTQWFLHPWDKPQGETSHCDSKSAADVTVHLDDILNRNQGKRVIVAGHHPVFTYGPHGGVFTWKDHIFPFTELNKNFYLPLPIVGSLLPLYRKYFGDIQDSAHPQNKALRRGLKDIMKQYPGTVYASGHEHGLQYIEDDSVYYVVSGGGSASATVKRKGSSLFASSDLGFARMMVMQDGGARLEYYTKDGAIFSNYLPKIKSLEVDKFARQEGDSLWVMANASYQYETGSFRRNLLGENYRSEWVQKLPLLAFDINKEKGGLKIIQKGGGMETMALRLRDSVGREYFLRSVEKYPAKALPPAFRRTFIQGVKQDQVSASHPYGALVIPPLAAGAGIYHTNPQVVYAPDDPNWGTYRKDFRGQVMLFEERPDGPGKGMPYFGSPEKMIGTHKLLEHMTHSNDVQVDQKMVLRSRLFDMWIGDWDRHDDQWRWGEFDQKKTKLYRPIPRDRDQAFFVNEGFVPNQWRKRHLFPNLEGFDYRIKWAPGLMQVGRWFDRSFLNAMPEGEFLEEAHSLSMKMTDELIDSALHRWPGEIYKLHGKEIADKLKARRSVLVSNAQTYYRFLSKSVDVVGSNKREWFDAEWLPNGNLNLQMFKRDKEGQRGKLLYSREFIQHQTKEIDLYGLDGDDVFHFSGQGHGNMKVRIIGGNGLDEVNNDSKGETKIFLYDDKNGATKQGNRIKDRTSADPHVNDYDRKAFEYDKFAPRNSIAYNVDDGIFIGTGFSTIAHGFRKKPYKSHHLLTGAYAIKTSSFNIRYEGRFPELVGKWNLELDADVKSPNYVNNFFGWGNESVFDQNINQQPGISVGSSIDYYRMRFREFKGDIQLGRKIGQWSYFRFGPAYQRGQIVDPGGTHYIKEYSESLPEPVLNVPKDFVGITETFTIDKRDNHSYTTRGIVFKQSSRWMNGFDAPFFSSYVASFTLYQSFRLPARVTYVFNAGGGHNTGTYQLYQAQALDGKSEIRGYHKTRFYGDTKLYFNNEVRVKLGSLRTYLFPAAIGMHVFYDVGRVWYKDENGIDPSAPSGKSDKWHKGYGGGLWLTPYDLTTIVTEVGHSEEGTLFYLRLGFLF